MTKAWSLEAALADIAPAVGPNTTILPLLNGLARLERVNDRFGRATVLGGTVRVVTTVRDDGSVFQLKPGATLVFGEQDRQVTDRVARIRQEFAVPGYDRVLSEDVLAAMWHK